MDIKDFGLSERTTNALIRNGVTTVEDLKNTTTDDIIYKFKQFGRQSLGELLTKMKEEGIHLQAYGNEEKVCHVLKQKG